ncbi:hypothetical protein [Brachybacterium muris]|uniref:hypothetical protein n=1 Tax=Brachybacterium muris TaxID=219301 RepID=UPI00223BACB7|nr:hypothetical protein [Brachybacterium muris]MCT1654503.1 hypothetical protein [Brachybacterium muris]
MSNDILVEATFEYDATQDVLSMGRGSVLPSLDLRLDFNQLNLTPVRLSLGALSAEEDDVFPFRFELPLYDVDVALDADKLELLALSIDFSSGTYFGRNLAGETFDGRRTLSTEVVNRTARGCGVDVELQALCFWKPEKHENDIASVMAAVQGAVRFATPLGVKNSGARGSVGIERTMRVVLDFRGQDGSPFGHKVFKMFPSAIVDREGRVMGEPFHFQLEHGVDIPIDSVSGASLVASIYVK